MSTWAEVEELLKDLTADRYSRDAEARASTARNNIRRVFIAMDRKADENDTLRQMLVDLGIENARLSVSLEQERTRNELAAQPSAPSTQLLAADEHRCAGCSEPAAYSTGTQSWCGAHGPSGTIAQREDAKKSTPTERHDHE